MNPKGVTITVRLWSNGKVPTTQEMNDHFEKWGKPYNITIDSDLIVGHIGERPKH